MLWKQRMPPSWVIRSLQQYFLILFTGPCVSLTAMKASTSAGSDRLTRITLDHQEVPEPRNSPLKATPLQQLQQEFEPQHQTGVPGHASSSDGEGEILQSLGTASEQSKSSDQAPQTERLPKGKSASSVAAGNSPLRT